MCWKIKMNNLEFNKKIDAFRNSMVMQTKCMKI